MTMFESLYFIVPILAAQYYYSKNRWDFEGMNYSPFSDTSFPNPTIQLGGNKWSSNSQLKSKFKKTNTNTLKLDNFNFANSFKFHLSPFKFLFHKNAEIFIDPLKMTGTVVMLSPTGGGKTVTMEALLNQEWYSRALINEEKGGDLVKRWYSKRKDIILNLYDERSHVWDPLSEDLEIVAYFFQNLLAAVVGDKPNFFNNDAKRRYKTIARLTIKKTTSKEKWEYFFEQLNIMVEEVKNADQESVADVVSTMEQIEEMLKLIEFQLHLQILHFIY